MSVSGLPSLSVSSEQRGTLFARLKGLLDWSDPGKCLFVSAFAIPFIGTYWLLGEQVLAHPEIAPYYDLDALRLFQRWLLFVIFAYFLFSLWSFWHLRRGTTSKFLVHSFVQTYAVTNAVGDLCVGGATTPYSSVMLGAAAVGLALFERRADNELCIVVTLVRHE